MAFHPFAVPHRRTRLLPLVTAATLACASLASSSVIDDQDGYEYVIITPDEPVFLAWADSLRSLRTLQGVSTGIFDTAEIGYTWQAIRDFLANAYWSWTVPPEAVLLLGDAPESGEQFGVPVPIWENSFVSDNLYADVDGDGLPNFVIARLTARSEIDLSRMVGKVLAHERNPSLDPTFYAHPVFASGWEPDGHSVMQTETYLGFLSEALDQSPRREYIATSPGGEWPDPDWVATFGPAGLDYLPATPEYLTDWDGSAARINADINAGAYFVLHRGMGQITGWGDPPYDTGDVAGLNNASYPFVFCLEALSGQFDYPATCLTEAFHRSPHGALGVISASGLTYATAMRQAGLYLIDCLWPDFLPETAAFESELRPAFALAEAKRWLSVDGSGVPPQQKRWTYHVLHCHGEPYSVMHDRAPTLLTVVHDPYCAGGSTEFIVDANPGSRIGLTIDGELVGAAFGTGAPLPIPLDPPALSGHLRIVVTQANHLRYDARVPIWDASAADPAPEHGSPICRILYAGPNPTRGSIRVRLFLERGSDVRCELFSISGAFQCGETLGPLSAGLHEIPWDCRDRRGEDLSPGLYLMRVTAGFEQFERKLLKLQGN